MLNNFMKFKVPNKDICYYLNDLDFYFVKIMPFNIYESCGRCNAKNCQNQNSSA